jgi:hypothetical protein
MKRLKWQEVGALAKGIAIHSLPNWEDLALFSRSSFDVFIDGDSFKDEYGRELILKGINLAAKVPSKPDGATYLKRSFKNHREVSFVGRPFPIEEAPEHFARLKHWGFTLLRLSVSWEAVEHSGYGVYDEEYLDYLEKLVSIANLYGFKIFIDFHQDVWSRFTGGDGAPGWTLESVGFNIENLQASGATVLHDPNRNNSHILWPTNAYKLGAATMFTLFFAGDVFAKNRKIEGKSVQTYLRQAYISMVLKVVERVKGHASVIGYDLMNEPFSGYIDCEHLGEKYGMFQLGHSPTPFEGMILADGNAHDVDFWEKRSLGIKKIGKKRVNSGLVRAWRNDLHCIWKEEGIWDYSDNGVPILLKPHHFKGYNFEETFYKPFVKEVGKKIHEIDSKSILLVEHVIGSHPIDWKENDMKNIVFSTHWYDGVLLATKQFFSFFGFDLLKMKKFIRFPKWIRKEFAKQIAYFKKHSKENMNNVPLLVSEFGIPHDLGKKKAYQNGNFSKHDKALHRSYQALEDNLASSVLWNYTVFNTNKRGDLWNDEDLSIFSRDQQDAVESIYSGARAKNALIRPYPMKTAGKPISQNFKMKKRVFTFEFEHDPNIVNLPTEIFLPHLHFDKGYVVEVSDGFYEVDEVNQILKYFHTLDKKTHFIKITAKKRKSG